MGKNLSLLQWCSLGLLLGGVVLVQIPENSEEAFEVKEGQNRRFGITIVILACISSGFASVYFEKIVKSSAGTCMWAAIFMCSAGGLTIAVVVKYADNILKGFATSVAIIGSSVLSWVILGQTLSPFFIPGAGLVISAVFLYGREDALAKTKEITLPTISIKSSSSSSFDKLEDVEKDVEKGW
eukprot:Pgem_evm1s13445